MAWKHTLQHKNTQIMLMWTLGPDDRLDKAEDWNGKHDQPQECWLHQTCPFQLPVAAKLFKRKYLHYLSIEQLLLTFTDHQGIKALLNSLPLLQIVMDSSWD